MATLAVSSFVALVLAGAPTVYLNAHLPSPADNQAMAALGASGVRMDFNWFDFQPAPTRWEWAALDAAVSSARAQGLSVFATVAYTPQWASSVGSCTPFGSDEVTRCENKLPADVQAWTAAVTAVVTRYRGQVDCWGIWNEPNLRTFFDGTLEQFVTRIFEPAARAIRAADPQGRICGPELSHLAASSNWNGKSGTCAFGGCIRNGWERDLGQLLDRVGPHLDVITHHVYRDDAAGAMQALLDGETQLGVLVHDSVKNVIASKGYAHKEVWITETGWEHPPQGNLALADVATRITDLYAKQEEVCGGAYAASLNDPWPNWTRTYYYHFPYDPGSGWGLVGPNQAPLAPYTALQNWARGRTTTACAGPRSGGADGGVVTTGGGSGSTGGGSGSTGGGSGSIGGGTGGGSGSTGGGSGSTGGGSGNTGGGGDVGGPSVGGGAPPIEGGCSCTSLPGSGVLLLGLLASRRRHGRRVLVG